MNKKIKAGIATAIIAIAGGLYTLLRKSEQPKPQPPPVVTASPSPAPPTVIEEPTAAEPQPIQPKRVAKAGTRALATTVETEWTFPDDGGIMAVPANTYRSVVSFQPATNYITGLEDYGGYIPCEGAGGQPEQLPCAYVFQEAKTRWVLMRYCASGFRAGTPPVCQCRNGYLGNSGKCR